MLLLRRLDHELEGVIDRLAKRFVEVSAELERLCYSSLSTSRSSLRVRERYHPQAARASRDADYPYNFLEVVGESPMTYANTADWTGAEARGVIVQATFDPTPRTARRSRRRSTSRSAS